MATEKNLYGRIVQKIDTEANWLKAINFIPNKGEIIIYEKDTGHAYDRIKIGDGVSNVNDLPFANELVQADWNQTDENAKDFILNKPVPITDDEIDAICGGDLTLDITENALVDTITGIVYRIYVEDGKLSMKQVNESASTEQLVFVDTSTDIVYKVYVEDGKLHMMEVE